MAAAPPTALWKRRPPSRRACMLTAVYGAAHARLTFGSQVSGLQKGLGDLRLHSACCPILPHSHPPTDPFHRLASHSVSRVARGGRVGGAHGRVWYGLWPS